MNREIAEIYAELAAERCGVTVAEVFLPTNAPGARSQSVARARRWAMALCRAEGWSFPEIGRVFGRDHTTCIPGVRKAQREHPELAEPEARRVG